MRTREPWLSTAVFIFGAVATALVYASSHTLWGLVAYLPAGYLTRRAWRNGGRQLASLTSRPAQEEPPAMATATDTTEPGYRLLPGEAPYPSHWIVQEDYELFGMPLRSGEAMRGTGYYFMRHVSDTDSMVSWIDVVSKTRISAIPTLLRERNGGGHIELHFVWSLGDDKPLPFHAKFSHRGGMTSVVECLCPLAEPGGQHEG